MKIFAILLFPLMFWFVSGCDSPTGGFERINNIDPLSSGFQAGSISGLQVTADTAGVITVRWADTDENATKILLEKSLGDTLNYELIAELKPETRLFLDTSFKVYKDTYYRLSSFLEVSGREDVLLEKSQAVLQFGELIDLRFEFLNAEKSLKLSWQTDVPFFTHFIITSDKILSEQQENTVKIIADGVDHSFNDPLLNIDFETRAYTITGFIEQDGGEVQIIEGAISFNAKTSLQPNNVAVTILNEQDWEISWSNVPFFATNVEVIRLLDPHGGRDDIVFTLPQSTVTMIDSTLIYHQFIDFNRSRKYQVRFLTDQKASMAVNVSSSFYIPPPMFIQSGTIQVDPDLFTLRWTTEPNRRNLIKEFIIEERRQNLFGWGLHEIGRVSPGSDITEFTITSVDATQLHTFMVRTLTSFRSEPATYLYSRNFDIDHTILAGMNFVTRMETSADKRYLVAVSFKSGTGNSIRIYDLISRQHTAAISIPSQQISDFKLSHDEQHIYFSVPQEGAIYRADFPMGNNMAKVIDDASFGTSGVFHIDVSRDGSFIIGTGGRGFVKRWSLETFEPEFIYNNPNSPSVEFHKNIAISPDGASIAGNDSRNFIMNAQDGTIVKLLSTFAPNVLDIKFSADGRYFAFVERSTASIFSTENWQLLRTFPNSRRIDFHPEKPVMVIGGGYRVFTLDLESLKEIDVISDERGFGPSYDFENALSFIDDDRIALVSGNTTIMIWKRTESQGWKFIY